MQADVAEPEAPVPDPDGAVLSRAAQVKTFRWTFPEDWDDRLTEGTVFKAEIVLRLEELRHHVDGSRWVVGVLELGDPTD